MYTRLTKTTIVDGRKCVSCIYQGTDPCLIHTAKVANCGQCKVFAAMLNQLYAFENAICEETKE